MADGSTDLFPAPAVLAGAPDVPPAATEESIGAVAVRAEPRQGLLGLIETLIERPDFNFAALEKMLDMQERLEARQAEREFNEALGRLSAKMPRVKKNGTIDLIDKRGHNKGILKFAKWEDIDKIIRPLLGEEGFTLSFNSAPRTVEGGGLIVTGTLLHRDGHSRSASMPLALDTGPGRNNLQAMGSTLSYGKRYCAEMLLNIVREGEDDDGRTGGAEYVSAEQCANLQHLIRETGTNLDRFLNTFGISALPDLPAAAYTAAHNMLASKAKKAEG